MFEYEEETRDTSDNKNAVAVWLKCQVSPHLRYFELVSHMNVFTSDFCRKTIDVIKAILLMDLSGLITMCRLF